VGPVEALAVRSVRLEEVNWLRAEPLAPGGRCEVQVRHRARAVPATVSTSGSGTLDLELLEPAHAVAPGQSGALYDGDRLIGGGVIA